MMCLLISQCLTLRMTPSTDSTKCKINAKYIFAFGFGYKGRLRETNSMPTPTKPTYVVRKKERISQQWFNSKNGVKSNSTEDTGSPCKCRDVFLLNCTEKGCVDELMSPQTAATLDGAEDVSDVIMLKILVCNVN